MKALAHLRSSKEPTCCQTVSSQPLINCTTCPAFNNLTQQVLWQQPLLALIPPPPRLWMLPLCPLLWSTWCWSLAKPPSSSLLSVLLKPWPRDAQFNKGHLIMMPKRLTTHTNIVLMGESGLGKTVRLRLMVHVLH